MAWRKLKANHTSAVPRRFMFFDTETRSEPDKINRNITRCIFRLGHVSYGRYADGKLNQRLAIDFHSPEVFWQFVEANLTRGDCLWIVAHNLLFDLRAVAFVSEFDSGRWALDSPRSKREPVDNKRGPQIGKPLVVLDNPPVIIGMRHIESGCRVVLVDSFNWFQDSIETMGEHIGLAKLTMPDDAADDVTWLEYCRRDVEILEQTFCKLIHWCEWHKLGMFRYSAAGQAMAAFRHRFKSHDICFHDDEKIKGLERAGYYGGQTECYRLGGFHADAAQLDVNSLYPSVMIDNVFPVKLARCEIRPQFLALPPSGDYSRMMARVLVKTSRVSLPYRLGGNTLHVVGVFKTVLAGPELAMAAKLGLITHWASWAEYDCEPIFREYVDYFWTLRKQYQWSNGKLLEQFCKKMLNSLYGKFGQLAPKWIDRPNIFPDEPWSTWCVVDDSDNLPQYFRSVGWATQEKMERAEMATSFAAIPAFVTSYGRLRMRDLRNAAGKETIYYQGVDSLIVSSNGLCNLAVAGEICPNTLGKMRLQATAHHGEIINVGDYAFGDKLVVVGRKRNSSDNGDGSFTQSQFDGPAALFSDRGTKAFGVTQVTKCRRQHYKRGTVGDDGRVTPLEIHDAEPLDAADTFAKSTQASATSVTRSVNV